jgi:hypothetical protein
MSGKHAGLFWRGGIMEAIIFTGIQATGKSTLRMFSTHLNHGFHPQLFTKNPIGVIFIKPNMPDIIASHQLLMVYK